MTRFARAKGSKSSNEKKPEEATSWSEMKKTILSKSSNEVEKTKWNPTNEKKESTDTSKMEWASLEDEFSSSVSSIKKHLEKNNKNSDDKSICKPNVKKRKLENNCINKDDNKKQKNKEEAKRKNKKEKLKITNSEVSENNISKKQKKRKQITADEEFVLKPKKKKAIVKSETSTLETVKVEKNKQDIKNFETKQSNKFKVHDEKQKKKEKFKNNKFEKNQPRVEELIINGEKIPICKFQGFYITLEDSERLKKLRQEMKKEGIPKAKIEVAIKLERRRAEKALSRLKKSVCFHCRGHGHLLSNCPELVEKENTSTGICYKCGSTEHFSNECKVIRETNFKFAECFICKEQGHIARQCPDNPRGLYPQGGACRNCGDVTHLRKDCPQTQAQKSEETVVVGLRNDRNLECLDEEIERKEKQNVSKKIKKKSAVKF